MPTAAGIRSENLTRVGWKTKTAMTEVSVLPGHSFELLLGVERGEHNQPRRQSGTLHGKWSTRLTRGTGYQLDLAH